jgi:hypothetical protein
MHLQVSVDSMPLSHMPATSANWAPSISVSEVFRDPSKILVKQILCLSSSLAETTTDKTIIPYVNIPDKNPVKWSESSIGILCFVDRASLYNLL